MTFTKEQMAVLSAYESYMETAVRAQWARYPGQSALEQIYDIYTKATGERRAFRVSCGTCNLHLLQDCGRLYFQQKAETPAPRKRTTKTTNGNKEN